MYKVNARFIQYLVIFLGIVVITWAGTSTHTQTITIANAKPNLSVVSNSPITLTSNGLSELILNFTVNDTNGVGGLSATRLNISINHSNKVEGNFVNDTADCYQVSSGGNGLKISCEIALPWYIDGGAWTINATVTDSSGDAGNVTADGNTVVTINELDAVATNQSTYTCGTLASPSSNTVCGTFGLGNNGNQNYTVLVGQFNLSARDLDGDTTASSILPVAKFIVNITSAMGTVGQQGQNLTNTTGPSMSPLPIAIQNGTLSKGLTFRNATIYNKVSVDEGKAAEQHSSTAAWTWTLTES